MFCESVTVQLISMRRPPLSLRTRLQLNPLRLFLPEDGTSALQIEGGSGYLAVVGDADVAVYDDENDAIEARGPGQTLLSFTDRFTNLTAEIVVDVIASKTAELTRSGRNFRASRAIGAGDLNQDGFPDAIVSLESSVGGFPIAPFMSMGAEDGLSMSPVQVLNGRQREQRFGTDIALGDDRRRFEGLDCKVLH